MYRELSNITPAKMVAIFKNNAPLQAEILKKEFLDLWIEVEGEIFSMSDTMIDYVSISLRNKPDNVHIAANFDKPIPKELLILNNGDNICLKGKVFNIGQSIVVLDHCKLVKKSKLLEKNHKINIKSLEIVKGHKIEQFGKYNRAKIIEDRSRIKFFKDGFVSSFIWKFIIPTLVIIIAALFLYYVFGIK